MKITKSYGGTASGCTVWLSEVPSRRVRHCLCVVETGGRARFFIVRPLCLKVLSHHDHGTDACGATDPGTYVHHGGDIGVIR